MSGNSFSREQLDPLIEFVPRGGQQFATGIRHQASVLARLSERGRDERSGGLASQTRDRPLHPHWLSCELSSGRQRTLIRELALGEHERLAIGSQRQSLRGCEFHFRTRDVELLRIKDGRGRGLCELLTDDVGVAGSRLRVATIINHHDSASVLSEHAQQLQIASRSHGVARHRHLPSSQPVQGQPQRIRGQQVGGAHSVADVQNRRVRRLWQRFVHSIERGLQVGGSQRCSLLQRGNGVANGVAVRSDEVGGQSRGLHINREQAHAVIAGQPAEKRLQHGEGLRAMLAELTGRGVHQHDVMPNRLHFGEVFRSQTDRDERLAGGLRVFQDLAARLGGDRTFNRRSGSQWQHTQTRPQYDTSEELR